MAFLQKFKPWSQRPMDHNGGDQTSQWMDWVTANLNQLAGQAAVPPQTGFQSLQTNTIDPTTSTIISKGNRPASIVTALTFIASATQVQFFWDGTNSSQVFTISRDDGSVYTNPAGSGLICTGLTNNTKYFFYPFFNEVQQAIQFASVPGISVGSPSIAFTVPNRKAAQQQILQGNILLGILMATTGITTPNAGSNPAASGGSGGGGVGGGPDRGSLQ